MSAVQIVARPDVQVFHATWADLLEALPRREDGTVCDALIVDAPYSDRTHAGHDRQAASVNHDTGSDRRALDYTHWTPSDVDAFGLLGGVG